MLRTVSSLEGYTIRATNDDIGEVTEAYFDDERWGLRYLVVETGSWLAKRTVLISPYAVNAIQDPDRAIVVTLTRQQVKNSPDIDTNKPVSRQHEAEYSRYYRYGAYWTGPFLWGLGGYPVYLLPGAGTAPEPEAGGQPLSDGQHADEQSGDTHLRSSSKVAGYHIVGTDGDIGHVKDFIFDDAVWAIRYLLVDTRNWWPGGKKVLLATQWIEQIDWVDSTVQTRLTREQIRQSPEYDENIMIDRDYETRLHDHYGRHAYWDD